MQFSWHDHGDWVEARTGGPLDNESAEPLFQSLNELIRKGHHRLMLDVSGVSYLSSAGISTLLKTHKQLTAIRGFFAVCEPSAQVAEVLRLTKMDGILVRDRDAARHYDPYTSTMLVLADKLADQAIRTFDDDGLAGTVYCLRETSPLQLELIGDPTGMDQRRYSENDVREIRCDADTFSLGLGALGPSFADSRDRFGEFVSIGGAAAHQPSGGRRAADFQTTVGDYLPHVQALYAMRVSGACSHLIRFRGEGDAPRVPVSAVIRKFAQLSDAASWAFVMVGESAGLVGASLMQSPATDTSAPQQTSLFQHPGVRNWLSFAPEHVHARSVAVVVGVVARAPLAGTQQRLSAWLRPLDAEGAFVGHLHAAVFGYRPIKKGLIDLTATVGAQFESESLQAVMHLLNDRRPINGAGESEFASGACWFGPLQ